MCNVFISLNCLVGVKVLGHTGSGLCSKLLAVYSSNHHSRSTAGFPLVFPAHITACQKIRSTR